MEPASDQRPLPVAPSCVAAARSAVASRCVSPTQTRPATPRNASISRPFTDTSTAIAVTSLPAMTSRTPAETERARCRLPTRTAAADCTSSTVAGTTWAEPPPKVGRQSSPSVLSCRQRAASCDVILAGILRQCQQPCLLLCCAFVTMLLLMECYLYHITNNMLLLFERHLLVRLYRPPAARYRADALSSPFAFCWSSRSRPVAYRGFHFSGYKFN